MSDQQNTLDRKPGLCGLRLHRGLAQLRFAARRAAAGHVHQMITAHKLASGNAGQIFYADSFGFALLWLGRVSANAGVPAMRSPAEAKLSR